MILNNMAALDHQLENEVFTEISKQLTKKKKKKNRIV